MTHTQEQIIALANTRGTVSLQELDKSTYKKNWHLLNNLHKAGTLERVSRGVFKLKDAYNNEYELVFGLEIETEFNKDIIGDIPQVKYITTSRTITDEIIISAAKAAKDHYADLDNNEYELVFGLEIETEFNKDIIGDIPIAEYHASCNHHAFNKDFYAERDGSLHSTTMNATAEFISNPTRYRDIKLILNNFKSTATKHTKDAPLSDVFKFNNSTGAHVHVSLLHHDGKQSTIKNRDSNVQLDGTIVDIKQFVEPLFLKKVARKFKINIKRELPQFYDNFRKNYYRKYAKRMSNNRRECRERYSEFNYQTSIPTIEFRSSHLRGITTWDDFEKYYLLLAQTFNDCFLAELAKNTPFNSANDAAITFTLHDDDIELNDRLCITGENHDIHTNDEV